MPVGPHACEHDKATAHAAVCATWVFSCIGQLGCDMVFDVATGWTASRSVLGRDMVFDVMIMGTLV